jgi:SAM-dependent methyltransferase
MTLAATERDLYQELWAAVPSYAENSPGVGVLPIFLQIVGKTRGHALDAGTGSGKGAVALHQAGFRVTMCDLTDAGLAPEAKALPFKTATLWHSLKPLTPTGSVDWVYCTDVLEHIPTQFTMLAVEQMLRVARRGVFIAVSVVPDTFGVWAGKALHQTVQSYGWWKDSLSEIGRVTDARDLLHAGTFYVEPR